MQAKLKKLPYSPMFTNAGINRNRASQCLAAGMTPAAIARAWPRVWKLSPDGKLSQVYDSELSDGRLETRYTILQSSVDTELRKLSARL